MAGLRPGVTTMARPNGTTEADMPKDASHEAPLPFIPAEAGIQSRLLAIRDLGPRFRGDERMLHGLQPTGTRSNSHISRRTLVRAGFGAIAAPAVLRVIAANAQSRVIKIGHVSPKTGPLAGFGEADGFILEQVRGILSKGLQSGGRPPHVPIIIQCRPPTAHPHPASAA